MPGGSAGQRETIKGFPNGLPDPCQTPQCGSKGHLPGPPDMSQPILSHPGGASSPLRQDLCHSGGLCHLSSAVLEPTLWSTPPTQGHQQLFLWWPPIKWGLLKHKVFWMGDPAVHDIQKLSYWKPPLCLVPRATVLQLPKVLKAS